LFKFAENKIEMKKLVLIAFFLVGAFATQAQELKWYTDVREAVTVSNKEQKPMLMFFTGSDWCGWCIRLQNEVLKTPEFKKWATDNVILVELDYPRRTAQTPELKNQNSELQQAFGIQGFPTVFFTSAESKDGRVNFKGLGQTGYVAGGPSAWLTVAEGIVHPKKS